MFNNLQQSVIPVAEESLFKQASDFIRRIIDTIIADHNNDNINNDNEKTVNKIMNTTLAQYNINETNPIIEPNAPTSNTILKGGNDDLDAKYWQIKYIKYKSKYLDLKYK